MNRQQAHIAAQVIKTHHLPYFNTAHAGYTEIQGWYIGDLSATTTDKGRIFFQAATASTLLTPADARSLAAVLLNLADKAEHPNWER